MRPDTPATVTAVVLVVWALASGAVALFVVRRALAGRLAAPGFLRTAVGASGEDAGRAAVLWALGVSAGAGLSVVVVGALLLLSILA